MILIYDSTLIINGLMTAVLLFGQAVMVRSVARMALAGGYLLMALMAVSHALSLPGLLSEAGLWGGGSETAAWLYVLWHAGFALFVLGYATLEDGGRRPSSMAGPLVTSILTVVAAAGALTLLAAAGRDRLPPLLLAKGYTEWALPVMLVVLLLNALAMIAVWRRRPRAALDPWLVVAMCAWLFDIALWAGPNAGPFDLGFYGGRACGILAGSLVLVALLLENGALYARLAAADQRERGASSDLLRASRELDAANRELDAFSHSVSHDLRAPLRGLDGCATILAEDYGERLGVEGHRLIEAMRGDCTRMARLIDDLLAFARLGRRPLESGAVALNELVDAVLAKLSPACEGRDIRFSVAGLGSTQGDSALLNEAFTNLLSNAIKFTGGKDVATVEVGSLRDPAFDGPIYFVKDDGAGFDMRHADKLFRVFERLHRQDEYEGTGVGLAIAQRVIQRHGGRIWAEAEPGRGATFYFTLQPGLP